MFSRECPAGGNSETGNKECGHPEPERSDETQYHHNS
jgi:hypothetical protein